MSDREFLRAEQRVKEMNRMAQQYIRQGNNFMSNINRQQVQPRFEPVQKKPDKPVAPSAPPPRQDFPRPQFNLDNEKLLIILIMYLLIKEKADIKLIAALGYLLL